MSKPRCLIHHNHMALSRQVKKTTMMHLGIDMKYVSMLMILMWLLRDGKTACVIPFAAMS